MNNNNKSEILAFTVEYPDIVKAIMTKVSISSNVYGAQDNRSSIEYSALWDTGANGSAISVDMAQKLALIPTSVDRVYHANGSSMANIYNIDIYLPNNIVFVSVPVIAVFLADFDILIGMDIISRGDFAITASQGKTKFTFQIPSTHNTDYLKELEANHQS
jgi:predicted aspartyl protease